ncbi:MAG: vWA domain-containing protein, partial [Polyangiaceae bacterium]
IWRGVIQHAAPGAPRPVEEVVWVPGPWRDPALLEWQRGGRAELKIFPIPRNGSRRIVLAYTQHVAPSAGVRRYVYPLATRGGPAAIDEASFDVQVLGADQAIDVHARGYDLAPRDASADRTGESRGPRLGMSRSPFAPSGDLVVEYATADRATEVSAFGFAPPGGAEDGFVALALRPRLPARIATRGRDQVLVVDAGRAMFGERLRRADRLAVTITQQMDRRDRVTILACDLECRAMPGGWHAPGAAAAHDVDAFLAGIEADGASDLVGAVRAAAAVGGRDAGHDLRVVLLSDGAASAGYRSMARVAAEVGDALPDRRAEVITVPIGSDADVDTLGEIARGGGGAVVPYAPGQAIDVAALDVLAATYGAALRDVEVILPEGLRDVVPAKLPTIRAGSETLLAARLHGDRAAGDVVLRGNVAGEPFEARWPIEVRAAGDDGNAWAARTWAAMRVADDERAGDDAARAESVSLSHRFRVPSRSTSLLVLESEAMFRAFGIARAEHAFEWTGESEAKPTETAALPDTGADDEKNAGALGLGNLARAGGKGGPMTAADSAGAPAKEESGRLTGGFAAQATAPPSPPPTATAGPAPVPERAARPGRWMRRVWFRTAAIAADDRPAVDLEKLATARAALAASPDARQRHAELARLLVRQGNVADVEALATKWTERDPLDADALILRATAKAWRGDRDGALRVLSGMLASPSMAVAAQSDLASTLARAEERVGRASPACALRVAAAETRPGDVAATAAALACERAERGDDRTRSESRWLAALKDDATRTRVSAAAAKLAPGAALADAVFGDIVVDATWDASAGVDLDVAVVDPSGRRLSWASAARNVRASDCASASHEALALTSGGTGPFVVEVVRADRAAADRPVSGKLRITALGRTQIVPFVLGGTRAQVARVTMAMDSRLEPIADGWTWGTCDPPFFTDSLGVRRMKPGCR